MAKAVAMLVRWLTVFALASMSGIATAQDSPALASQKQKVSYALGMDLGNQLRKSSIDVDPAVFAQGLKDALSGGKTLMTAEQAKATIGQLQAEMKSKVAAEVGEKDDEKAELQMLAAYNKKAGEAFLAENRKKDGVVSLPSGLQYKILKQGTGRKPALTDTVTCHFRGTFLDGREFYNSHKLDKPVTHSLRGIIKAWAEALPLMTVGSTWQLFVPSELAYGEKGYGPIGPNTTLIYEVELIAIQDKQ